MLANETSNTRLFFAHDARVRLACHTAASAARGTPLPASLWLAAYTQTDREGGREKDTHTHTHIISKLFPNYFQNISTNFHTVFIVG